MQKLVQGVHHFQSEVFAQYKGLFEHLSKGQSPETLFITCSDSRINPCLITQTEPGELFIIRNAGNIIPPYDETSPGGEEATIEYAVSVLGVRDIIVCGHTLCGAMQAVLEPENLNTLPAVRRWLAFAEETRSIIKKEYCHLSGEALQTAAAEENVLVQLEHLMSHPTVAQKLEKGEINLHGWVYKIQTGEVFAYQPQQEQFILASEAYALSTR